MKKLVLLSMVAMLILQFNVHGQTEKDRGVVAIPSGDDAIFLSWRLFETDPDDIAFNVYRSNESEDDVLLNDSPITQGTNFVDKTADLTKSNTYRVVTVSGDGTLLKSASASSSKSNVVITGPSSNHEPYFTVPLRNGRYIHFVWVGDLNGDGQNDFVVDRLGDGSSIPDKIEAYTHNGTFLWEVDYGHNSLNRNNISPGSSAISTGHWDGVTVGDVTGDGRAEVITRVANGVTFGDGNTWNHSNDNRQWIVTLDGATGALINYSAVPQDFLSTGPLAMQMGVGANNHIYVHAKNRNSNGSFNVMDLCYVQGSSLTLKWKTLNSGATAHQFRIVDLNGDGVDDMANIGYVLNGVDGSILYTLPGIIHGDRFQIGKFDPNRPGLQGYGVQQNNSNGIVEYYYDATTGEILWTHVRSPYDNGRGNAADIDPNYPGYEVWSFEGIYNGPSNTQITQEPDRPWPNFRLWWDGDDGSELYDNGKIERWNPNTNSTERIITTSDYNGVGSWRGAPLFYGDIIGDWREEVVLKTSDNSQLVIFTTNIPTDISRPSLTTDQYYKNCLTLKGYMQSHYTSYYLGEGGSSGGSSGGGSGGNGSFNGTYSIIASHSGKALDTYNWGTSNGTNIVQWNYWGGDAQRYNISQVDGDWHRITPVIATDQGFDIAGVSTSDGANLQTYSYWGGDNQQFRFESAGSGVWRIIARHSEKCIDVEGNSTADGANVIQWTCISGASNQMFELINHSSAGADIANADNNAFGIFPNPAKNTIQLTVPDNLDQSVKVSIVNHVGQQMMELNRVSNGLNTIDVSSLEAGLYYAEIKYGTKTIMKKFTKQ